MTLRVRAPMPVEPPHRAAGWAVAAMPLVGLALFELVRMPLEARRATGYAAWHHPELWVYPTGEVEVCMTVLLVEAIAITLVLAARTDAPLGGRACLLAIGLFVLLLAFAPFAMHADATIGNLLGWQFLATAWLLFVGIARGLVALGRRVWR